MVLTLGILVCVFIWSRCIDLKPYNIHSMEYFICHGPWLNPMSLMNILHGMLIKHGSLLKGCINYMLWIFIYVIGGQGGDINTHWNGRASRLGLGLLCWVGPLASWMLEIFLYVVWWREAREVGCEGRCVSTLV